MGIIYREDYQKKKPQIFGTIFLTIVVVWIIGIIIVFSVVSIKQKQLEDRKGDYFVDNLGFTCGTMSHQTVTINGKYEFTVAITIYNNSNSNVVIDAPSFNLEYKISSWKYGFDYSINNLSEFTLEGNQYRTVTLKGYTYDSLDNSNQNDVYYLNTKIGSYK